MIHGRGSPAARHANGDHAAEDRRPAAPAGSSFDPTNPLIVQGDRSVLVEVDNPKYAEARDALAPFAELEKSPEHIHTYRITQPVALERRRRRDDRRGDGRRAAAVHQVPDPAEPARDIAETVSRYGRVKLERDGERAAAWSAPTSRCWRNCRARRS